MGRRRVRPGNFPRGIHERRRPVLVYHGSVYNIILSAGWFVWKQHIDDIIFAFTFTVGYSCRRTMQTLKCHACHAIIIQW